MKPYEIVILSILCFLFFIAALLILGKAKIRILCREKLRVILYVLGIPITLFSNEQKEEAEKKDLSRCHNPERVLKRTLRRKKRDAKKALTKRRKAERKKALRAAQKKAKKEQQQNSNAPKPNISENLGMITALLKRLYKVTHGKLHVRVQKLRVSIGTGDAAKTAILYGVVVQSASYLLAWIDSHFLHVERDDGALRIDPNYLEAKVRAEVDIVCSVHLSAALRIGVRMLLSYLSEKNKATKKAETRMRNGNAKKAVKN